MVHGAYAKVEHYQSHVYSTLIQSHDVVTIGQEIDLGVVFEMEPMWHIYWKNAGDAGLPTEVDFLADFLDAQTPLLYEAPKPFPYDNFINYGYKDRTVAFSKFKVDENAKVGDVISYQAQVNYLSCKDVCLPGEAFLEYKFTVGEKAKESSHAQLFKQAASNVPVKAPFEIYGQKTDTQVIVSFNTEELLTKEDVTYIPAIESTIVDTAPFTFEQNGNAYILTFEKSPYYEQDGVESVAGLLLIKDKSYAFGATTSAQKTMPEMVEITEPTASITLEEMPPENKTGLTVPLALLFAFIGGLILNLMPCVLPVLSLKVMSIIHHAKEEKPIKHGVAYTAGILTTFAVIGFALLTIRAGGEELGWGFQLQSPSFVAGLTLLMTLVALQLFGTFEIGHSLTRLGGLVKGHSLGSTYFGGILMTLVATPCTAPFMAPAFGFALTQEPAVTYATFFSLGLGLAAPYVLLTAKPSLMAKLPKAGPWEDTFKTVLGFPMLATALWLLWVYEGQTSSTSVLVILTGLLVVAFATYIFGKLNTPVKSKTSRKLGTLTFALGLFFFYCAVENANNRDANGQSVETRKEWSVQAVEADVKDGKTVFVDFTAKWCITCQVNKGVALRDSQLESYKQEYGAVFYEADWTLKDENITRELQKHGRAGVPLYIVYKNGNLTPEILPSVLTEDIVKNALK